MSARLVAAAIGVLADEPWMPRVSHWEIATTDGVWGAHAELDADTSGPAFRELGRLAETTKSALVEADRLMTVGFVHDEVPVRVWWLRPIRRWIIPATCATCPTALGGTGVRFVRLGEGGREAPVICVPCRDRMQAEFVAGLRRSPETAAEVEHLKGRITELETERHSTNEALDDAAKAIAEKGEQLTAAEQIRLAPHERLILRFALELAADEMASNSVDFTAEDTAAMDKLRVLSTGPVVAYRNPWRPGVLLCLEHGEGWEGMKPLSVEDLPNGGICTAGDPADPDDVCGRDVLIGADTQGGTS